jgi:hypothetical protein
MGKSQAEILLKQLCIDAHPRTEASLRLIYEICQEQAERGSQDFSVTTVGKLSAERGGPSPGAIRNKTGEKYRALIESCADTFKGHKKKRAARQDDGVDDILEGISDPVLRTRIGLLQAEVRALRGQVLALRKIASEKAVIELPAPAGAPPAASTQPALSDQQRKTLRDAISKKTLTHWGWEVDKNGRIFVEDSGQIVFGAGYVPAIEQVLKSM